MIDTQQDLISAAMRTALDHFDEQHDGTQLRAALIVLDIQRIDGTTDIIATTHPHISTAWTQGMLLLAAQRIT